jgi:hypothetical protein
MDSVWDVEAVGLAWLTAVIVTVFGEGIAGGGVKSPEVEIVPVVDDPPATPLTCQVTAWFAVLVTIAVSCTVDPSRA